jgi:hypothetical protein
MRVQENSGKATRDSTFESHRRDAQIQPKPWSSYQVLFDQLVEKGKAPVIRHSTHITGR